MKLSLAIITKNEQGIIGRCLNTVAHLVDEIIIVDTGSTDNTIQETTTYGVQIHHFDWVDDFSKARNYAFSKCTGDYILWLDADDILKPEDQARLAQLKPQIGTHDAYLMKYDYAQDEHGTCVCSLYRHRIVRKCPGIQWVYPIHECLSFHPGHTEQTTDITITHQRTEQMAAKDAGRNHTLLQRLVDAGKADPRVRFYHATELHRMGKNPEAVQQFREYLQQGGDWHDNMVNAWLYLSYALLAQQQPTEAIDACVQGIKLDPRWAEFYVLIGQIHYDQNNWQQAARWFELAIGRPRPQVWGTVIDDNYTWVPQDRICKCYYELGRTREAYEANERALTTHTNPRLLYNRNALRDQLFPGRTAERPTRLNLGAGAKPVPGYRRTDIAPLPGITETFDQSAIPYHDSTVQAIYSEHALEHCTGHHQAADILQEWSRVLRPRGHLTLKVPDLEECCRQFITHPEHQEWYKYTIYGIQRSNDGEPASAQYHHTGFTAAQLTYITQNAGFQLTKLERYNGWGTPSLHLEAHQTNKPLRVYWVVPNIDNTYPSARIRIQNIHRHLQTHNIDSQLWINPDRQTLRQADIVIYADLVDTDTIEWLTRHGITTIIDLCEDIQPTTTHLQAADILTCCSTVLTQQLSIYGQTRTIPDAYEPNNTAKEPNTGRLTVGWCGMDGNVAKLEQLRPIIADLDMDLMIISEGPHATIKWNQETWLTDLARADIVIAPQQYWAQPAKSNTKATQAMALGLPVIASPLQAYQEAIRHGETGFICDTTDDWTKHLTLLRDDATLRHKIGTAAQTAARPYSIDAVGETWIQLLEETARYTAHPPAVDIIIPTWQNLEYLKLCIDSIRTCTDWPYRLIIISQDEETAAWTDQQADITNIKRDRTHFSAACNTGVRAGTNPYIMLLNDDTIVSEGWLTALMRELRKPGIGVVGPYSNCDKGWLHDDDVTIGDVHLVPGMRIPQVQHIIPQIYKYRRPKAVHDREWIAFWAVLLARTTWDIVGELDEQFQSGCEDVDYCKRLRAEGLGIRQTYDSFIFHFGGTSRYRSEQQDAVRNRAEDLENHRRLAAKYNTTEFMPPAVSSELTNPKLRVAVFTGPAWEQWGDVSVNVGGIGGSETMAVHAARELARRGHEVKLFNDCGERYAGVYDGVEYIDYTQCEHYTRCHPIDLLITSRRADITAILRNVKQLNPECTTFCWVHDIWLSHDPAADINQSLIDKYLCLSPWHKQFFMQHHGVPEHQINITHNVIDHTRFIRTLDRDPYRFVYSSSPDRGLDVLLAMWPRLRRQLPEANLHIYYGFDNWIKSAQLHQDHGQLDWIQRIQQALQQPGIFYHGRVGQGELAEAFLQSSIWAYPTYFTETFCITAVEAMAAGLPVVCSGLAALADTVDSAGLLHGGEPRSREYQEAFIKDCAWLLRDREIWEERSRLGRERAARYTAQNMIDGWLDWCGKR